MNSIEVITAYNVAKKNFQETQAEILLDSIKFELAQLKDGETIKLSSSLADGDCIPTFEYNDHCNIIYSDGTCPVWNNNDCCGDHAHDDAKVSVNWNLETLSEILKCCFEHNKRKEDLKMTEDDFKHLDVVLQHLDPESELSVSLDKAVKNLKL